MQGDVVDSAYYLFQAGPNSTGNCFFSLSDGQNFISAFSIGQSVRFIKFNRQWDTVLTSTYQIDTTFTTISSLYPDSDSTFMASGSFYDEVTKRSNLYLCRLDTALNLLWEKRYYDTTNVPFGGFFGGYVIPAGQGFMIGVGGTYASYHSNKGFIIRTDAAGNESWKKEFSNKKGIGLVRLASR